MSNAFQSASHFLGGSFAPFAVAAGGGGAGGRDRVQEAPLFFSTLQEGDSDGEDGAEHAQAGPSRQPAAAYSSTRPRTSADSGGQRSDDDEEDHGGLGQYAAASDEDDDAASIDPFSSNPRSSSSRPDSRAGAAMAQTGWRMHQTSVLPSIKQSVINDIYDQAESVYTSVFLRDKGKQRASREDDDDGASPNIHEQGSPDTAAYDDVPAELQRDASGSGSVKLPLDSEKRTLHLSETIQRQFSIAGQSGQMHRWPMPTSVYRRRASRKRPPASEPEYQDQSPRDAVWLAVYLFNLLLTVLLGIWQFFFDTSSHIPDNLPTAGLISPSVALLHTLPLITGLVTCALLAACTIMAYLLLVKNGARHVVHLLICIPPFVLLVGAGWAFSSSYSHLASTPAGELEEVEHSTSAAETFLRWISFGLLGCSIVAMRFAFLRLASTRMERTIRVLEVAVDVLLAHPHIFILAFGLLASFIALSIPFLLLLAKLLIHGYVKRPASTPSSAIAYLVPSSWASMAAAHTTFVFLWTLAILRGILRMTIAGATGEWWFHRHRSISRSTNLASSQSQRTYSPRRAKRTVQEAFNRARGPSLGTICISALLMSTFTALSLVLSSLNALITRLRRRSTISAIPSMILRVLLNAVLLPLVAILGGVLKNVNDFALVHAGITGDRFSDSMSEAQQLIAGRNGTDVIVAHMVLKSLLNIFALGFAVLGGIAGYLANAYWPASDQEVQGMTPLLVALICGLLPYWSVRLAGDVLSNAVDATFVCFNIDLDMQTNNCTKAYEAFAYEDADEEESLLDEPPGAYPVEV